MMNGFHVQRLLTLVVLGLVSTATMAMELSGYIPPGLRYHYPENSFTIKINDFANQGIGFSNRFFHDTREVSIDEKGYFSIQIDVPSTYFYITFEGLYGMEPKRQLLTDPLLVRSDGKLHLDLSVSPLSYAGDLHPLVELQLHMIQKARSNKGKPFDEWESYFDYLVQWHGETLKSLDTLVERYSESVEPIAREIITLNAISQLSSSIVGLLPTWMSRARTQNLDVAPLFSVYDTVSKGFLPLSPSNDALKNSINYAATWLKMNRTDLMLREGVIQPDSVMSELFKRIPSVSDTLLRDRLLLSYYFLPEYKKSDFSNLSIAMELVKDPSVKDLLSGLMADQLDLPMVRNFLFFDDMGREIGISDLKGKLSVVHFWFNGCAGCRIMTDFMEDVIATYGKYEDVQFIGINVDKEKEKWVDGLATGKYSNSREMHLWTGAEGNRHPLLQAYNYVGFPQLMLVDKAGKVITSQASNFRTSRDEFKEKVSALIDEHR